ncbi:WG repeat-containing protein [Dysgonomonas reticulitermitis]
MNWQEIKVSPDNTHFLFEGNPIFNKHFIEVLKFHAPGLAPVKTNFGWCHIDTDGHPLYNEYYDRVFGFYCNRAAILHDFLLEDCLYGYNDVWFHIDEKGKRVYEEDYAWCGNYQENLCVVRERVTNNYFHIDLNGKRIYSENYLYAGDFKDGFACVKLKNGLFKHIDTSGKFINDKEFSDLGVFHKNFATAKDKGGWFHIDKSGNGFYQERYLAVEPFYNGFALVMQFDENKVIINEQGEKVLEV